MTAISTNARGSAISVRIAGREDTARITTIINSAFLEAEGFFVETNRIDLKNVHDFLETGNFLLAESDGTVHGCVYVEPRDDRAYLGLLAVDPALQHSGLGSVLMNAAEEYCRGLGASFMDIKIVNLRRELPAFYQKRGYVKTGTSPFPQDVQTKLPCHFVEMSKPLREGDH